MPVLVLPMEPTMMTMTTLGGATSRRPALPVALALARAMGQLAALVAAVRMFTLALATAASLRHPPVALVLVLVVEMPWALVTMANPQPASDSEAGSGCHWQ